MKARLFFLIMPLLLIACNGPAARDITEKALENQANEQALPIALGKLENQSIHFWCPDDKNCLPDIPLEDHFLIDPPYALWTIFYINPSSLYAVLYSSQSHPEQREIIHVNPRTGQVISVKFPKEFDSANFTVAGNHFILMDNDKKQVFLIQEDLSIKTIDLNFPANSLIVMKDQRVIALNKKPAEREDGVYVELSMIDPQSGNVSEQSLKLPDLKMIKKQDIPKTGQDYLISIEGISRDLENMFCLYFRGESPRTPRLGAFNLKSGKEVASTQDALLIRLTSGYAQYHEMLYTSYAGGEFGGVGPSLIDMSDARSLIAFANNPDLRATRLIIEPFGEDFLLTTKSQLVHLSSKGTIINQYPLPEAWIDQPYRVLSAIR